MVPFQFKVDIFSELIRIFPEKNELIVCSETINELKRIASGHSKDAAGARLALLFVKEKDINIENSNNTKVDDWIVSRATRDKLVVCTNDSQLRKRLRNIAIVVGLRERSHLQIVMGDYCV